MSATRTAVYMACLLVAACGSKNIKPSDKHIQQDDATPITGSIPETSKVPVVLPPPKPVAKVATYSVVVTNVPTQEILFALARDAKINLDIHAGIEGNVTLNAINQTLPQILDRIAQQVDMRYELSNGNLVVKPDSPYLKNYKIDYVNMSRDSEGGISNSSQLGGGSPSSGSGGTGGGTGASGNNSQLSIKNSSRNHFWDTLVKNITDILRETDKILPEGSSETVVEQNNQTTTTGTGIQPAGGKKSVKPGIESSPYPATLEGTGTTVTRRSTFREAASVIPNPEAGIITVRATSKQHEKIQDFITQVMRNARRQVLIEVTVAEVALNSNYQQGINWSKLLAPAATKGFNITQAATGSGLTAKNTASMVLLNYVNPTSKFGQIAASVSLLESFGDVKVLSSPKLSVMNNQTAVLRIVNNLVYFHVTVTPAIPPTATTPGTPATYNTTAQTLPVGFTMSLTPQISDTDTVQINLRPTITRFVRYVPDPNPGLIDPATGVSLNQIPEVQTREMESILRIENNQIAVLGGLMQDEASKQNDGVPLLADIPLFGNAFKNRNDTTKKTELVIFLRPTVIKDASLEGDFSGYRKQLPNADFFKQ